jgi:hypothetical protein
MTKPNFFIIGAPKCGTTSLATWLSEHSQIFMTRPKEPHFFNTDHSNRPYDDEAKYYALFPEEQSDYLAIGEASVHYLSSAVAVQNILAAVEDPKFIVCLRDPTDMVVSYHNQLFNALAEDIPDIQTAWAAQSDRISGKRIPDTCPEPSRLQYSESGKLARQMERLFADVPSHKVFVVFLDQIQVNPLGVYKYLLDFLNVPYDGKTDFPRLNSVARLRNRRFRYVLNTFGKLKENLGFPRFNSGILKMFTRMNMRSGERNAPIDTPFIDSVLRPYFADEAKRLERYRNPALDPSR